MPPFRAIGRALGAPAFRRSGDLFLLSNGSGAAERFDPHRAVHGAISTTRTWSRATVKPPFQTRKPVRKPFSENDFGHCRKRHPKRGTAIADWFGGEIPRLPMPCPDRQAVGGGLGRSVALRRDAHGSGPHGEGTPWGDRPPRRRPVSVAAAIHTEAYVNSGDKKPGTRNPESKGSRPTGTARGLFPRAVDRPCNPPTFESERDEGDTAPSCGVHGGAGPCDSVSRAPYGAPGGRRRDHRSRARLHSISIRDEEHGATFH